MKYATLFQNTSSADGFKIVNIPWVGLEAESESNLLCNEENKKISIDEQGNISIIEAGIPNDEIWYTSSDGNIVTPYSTSALPEIDTNTYSDGKGVIKFKTDVRNIGSNAFRNCSSLTSVTIPNSIRWISESTFNNCTSLTSVTFHNSFTYIGDYAFSSCSSLTSITIPNSVTQIGTGAFQNCSNLISVNITDITAWCNIAFGNSASNPLYYAKHLYVNNVEVTNLVIPEGVTSIRDWAFNYCIDLTSVSIPNSVTSIGLQAFCDCTGLTSVSIPNSVTSIGSSAFYGCSSLTSVTIPNSVTSIGNEAFGQISAKILFSKLYSTLQNRIFSTPLTEETYIYNVEFNISEIPTGYNILTMLPNVADSGKGTLTYNIYTDYAPCKDQALALATTKTIVNVYHIDGTPWE